MIEKDLSNTVYETTLLARALKNVRILLNVLDKLPIILVFFLSFILASTNRNASSPVDIFTGTVNAYVIAKYEESDPVIVNGLTAH